MYYQYSPNRSEMVFLTGSGNSGETLTSSDFIPFKTIGGNFSDRWNATNNFFKIPKSGIYFIISNVFATANVAGYLNLNKGLVVESGSPSSGLAVSILEYANYLNAGDEIGLTHSTGITLVDDANNHYIKIIGWA